MLRHAIQYKDTVMVGVPSNQWVGYTSSMSNTLNAAYIIAKVNSFKTHTHAHIYSKREKVAIKHKL